MKTTKILSASAFTLIELLVVIGIIAILAATVARHLGIVPAAATTNITASSGLVGGIEVAFMDGHAGPVRLPQLWALNWHNNWIALSGLPAPK